MRLIKEVCLERDLPAIINIHDVVLAQQFVERIVGLRAGEIVFDGPAEALTTTELTEIYGEEDWAQMRQQAAEEAEDAAEAARSHEERMPASSRARNPTSFSSRR